MSPGRHLRTALPLLHVLLHLLPQQRGRRTGLPQESHMWFSLSLGANAARHVLRLPRLNGRHGLGIEEEAILELASSTLHCCASCGDCLVCIAVSILIV